MLLNEIPTNITRLQMLVNIILKQIIGLLMLLNKIPTLAIRLQMLLNNISTLITGL